MARASLLPVYCGGLGCVQAGTEPSAQHLRQACLVDCSACECDYRLWWLFLLPQLIRYGTIRQRVQRGCIWVLLMKRNFGISNARSAALSTRLDLAFLAVFVGSLDQKGWASLFQGPLLIAYLLANFMGHLGFAMNDPHHRQLAGFIRATMPAPPATFVNQALLLLPFIKVMAVATLASWLWSLVKPAMAKTVALPSALAPVFVFVALVPLLWMDVPKIALFADEESSAFAEFARAASYIADDATIYINHHTNSWSAGFRLLFFA